MSKAEPTKLELKNVLCAWPRLFVAERYPPTDMTAKPRYGCNLVDVNDVYAGEIQEAIEAAALATFKGEADAMLAIIREGGRLCASIGKRTAAGKEYEDMQGHVVLNANKPGVDRNGNVAPGPVVHTQYRADGQLQLVNGETVNAAGVKPNGGIPYSGCFVNAYVNIWGQADFSGRINCSVDAVQFVAEGNVIGGGVSAAARESFFESGYQEEPTPDSVSDTEESGAEKPASSGSFFS